MLKMKTCVVNVGVVDQIPIVLVVDIEQTTGFE